jgi:hypothetical protein
LPHIHLPVNLVRLHPIGASRVLDAGMEGYKNGGRMAGTW